MPETSKIGRNLILLGGFTMAVAAFLPWGEVASVSVSGIKGDGVITLIVGLLSILIVFVKRLPVWMVIITGVIGAIVAIIDISEMSKTINSVASVLGSSNQDYAFTKVTGVGIGLYTTLIASILIIAGGLIKQFQKQRKL